MESINLIMVSKRTEARIIEWFKGNYPLILPQKKKKLLITSLYFYFYG